MKVLVVGGGINGLCSALDLVLRGVEVVLVEQRVLGSGTTTKCAGMLHSGARYLVRDENVARLCYEENKVWRKIIPFAIDTSRHGLFVVLPEYNREYVKIFEERRKQFDIKKVSRDQCLTAEPNINRSIEWGYETDDFVFNPFTIVEAYREELPKKGVAIFENTKIDAVYHQNDTWQISLTGENSMIITVNGIINATGAEASEFITFLKGEPLNLEYIHGSMAVLPERLSDRILSICDDNRAGDVVIPSGSRTLVGSTWHKLPHNQQTDMTPEDELEMCNNAKLIIPKIARVPVISSFTGIRVHHKNDGVDLERFRSRRDFNVIEHHDMAKVITLLSGKFVFGRLAAERAVDTLLGKLLRVVPRSQTQEYILNKPEKPVTQFLQ